MKKVIEVQGGGLESLIGDKVILFCANYFYAGTLEGVGKTEVQLRDPAIVYETGAFSDKAWKNAEPMHVPDGLLAVRIAMIESYCRGK